MSKKQANLSVLVSGASSGIGRACAIRLSTRGIRVFAGVRQIETGEDLVREAGPDVFPVLLDITDENSIKEATEIVMHASDGRGLNGLINNAGIAVAGPVQYVDRKNVIDQFSANVAGTISLIQFFLPQIRLAAGRIINIGSISGRMVVPFLGMYAASKYALEALTDALRMELASADVKVSIIEPGAVSTPIWEKSSRRWEQTLQQIPEEERERHRASISSGRAFIEKASAIGSSPSRVVDAILHALTSNRPKARYLIGLDSRLLLTARRLLPTRTADRLLMRLFSGGNS